MKFDFYTQNNEHHLWIDYENIDEITVCGQDIELTCIGSVWSEELQKDVNPKELGFSQQKIRNGKIYTEIPLEFSVNELIQYLLQDMKYLRKEYKEAIQHIHNNM